MIYLPEIQATVNDAYSALAGVQFKISVREPVKGDKRLFDKHFSISTKIVANLEYINSLNLNVSYVENEDIEKVVEALELLIDKAKKLCH